MCNFPNRKIDSLEYAFFYTQSLNKLTQLTKKKLKVLMLGWEFPPLLTGGLGPACFGLTKALSSSVDLHIILPQAPAKSLINNAQITGLNQLNLKEIQEQKLKKINALRNEIEVKIREHQNIQNDNLQSIQKQQQDLITEEIQAISSVRIDKNSAIQREVETLKEFQERELLALVKEETFEKIYKERIVHSYEDFAVVDYVNISLDPYQSNWIAQEQIVSKKVEKKISEQIVIKKEKVRRNDLELLTKQAQQKISSLQKDMEDELSQLRYFYQKAKESLQLKSIQEKTKKPVLDALSNELEEMVAFDWAYKQYLFEDTDTYGPRIMDKVAAYTEAVTHYASLQEFDIIHAHDWLTLPAAVAIKKQSKKPLIVHIHSLETDRTTNPEARNAVYDIEKKGMQAADAVVPVSRYTQNCIEANYGIESDKIYAVHNGITPYLPQLDKKNDRTRNILFLGRVTRQKGILYLVETASLLLSKVENVKFLVAGIGDQLREAMLLAQQKGISDKIQFLGFLTQEKVRETLAQTDVFFMPSVSDPFGLAALEAAQFGIPLVLSKQTGAAEVLPNSLRANYWDTEKFANYLYATLEYSGLQKELKAKTKKDITKATWENAANTTLGIYEKVLKDMLAKAEIPNEN